MEIRTLVGRYVPVIVAILVVTSCEEVAKPGVGGNVGGRSLQPATALTESITFIGGAVKSGSPPRPTNRPGDPQISGAPSTPSKLSPGGSGKMTIQYSSVPANTPFDVNVRFAGADSYINIPIDTSITQGRSSGTLNLPFSLPPSVCDNLDDINHQITCYESVSVGGRSVSKEQARQIVLNCESGGGSGFSGSGSFCAYNYPKASCDIVRDIAANSGYRTTFIPGFGRGACGNFPDVERTYDFGGTSSFCEHPTVGGCGACVIGGLAN